MGGLHTGIAEIEVFQVPELATLTWDNNGGAGDLQWETASNWDPEGEPDALSLCTIDNGDTVDLTQAGELAYGIELGASAAGTTLNVTGDLTVSNALNVHANGTLSATGTLNVSKSMTLALGAGETNGETTFAIAGRVK